jgi:N-acetylmuramoyl-L-alanine amidase
MKKRSLRSLDRIIVHCTATPAGRRVTLAEVRKWHLARGFEDIGYHYLIDIDGNIHQGRPLEYAGAHCVAYNLRSIGICYVGGIDALGTRAEDTRTPQQKAAMQTLIDSLRKRFGQLPVNGHRDFAAKECPSFDAAAEYNASPAASTSVKK